MSLLPTSTHPSLGLVRRHLYGDTAGVASLHNVLSFLSAVARASRLCLRCSGCVAGQPPSLPGLDLLDLGHILDDADCSNEMLGWLLHWLHG